ARTDAPGGVEPVIDAGAIGLKIHEDWGAYPEIVDATLVAAEAHDIAVCLHSDSLNESTELAGTPEAIGERTVDAYHVQGWGGGSCLRFRAVTGSPTTTNGSFGTSRR